MCIPGWRTQTMEDNAIAGVALFGLPAYLGQFRCFSWKIACQARSVGTMTVNRAENLQYGNSIPCNRLYRSTLFILLRFFPRQILISWNHSSKHYTRVVSLTLHEITNTVWPLHSVHNTQATFIWKQTVTSKLSIVLVSWSAFYSEVSRFALSRKHKSDNAKWCDWRR